ncbi:MAG: type II secretion system protein [Ruminococcus sp.]|nr:type II secretion system protein [Ruminococcus sp.]
MNKLKGFTLIELIVVIAIIGVLAAILVPSMLGYVQKAKIEGANSSASALHRAISAYIHDLDFDDEFVSDGLHTVSDGTYTEESDVDTRDFIDDMSEYFSDIDTVDAAFNVYCGECNAVAIKSKKYYGTYPLLFTGNNWKNYSDSVSSSTDALNRVISEKNIETSE